MGAVIYICISCYVVFRALKHMLGYRESKNAYRKICNLFSGYLGGFNLGKKSSMYVVWKWYKRAVKDWGHKNTVSVTFLFYFTNIVYNLFILRLYDLCNVF